MRQLREPAGDEGGQPCRLFGRQVRCGNTGFPAPETDHDESGVVVPCGAERRSVTVGKELPPLLGKPVDLRQNLLLVDKQETTSRQVSEQLGRPDHGRFRRFELAVESGGPSLPGDLDQVARRGGVVGADRTVVAVIRPITKGRPITSTAMPVHGTKSRVESNTPKAPTWV